MSTSGRALGESLQSPTLPGASGREARENAASLANRKLEVASSVKFDGCSLGMIALIQFLVLEKLSDPVYSRISSFIQFHLVIITRLFCL